MKYFIFPLLFFAACVSGDAGEIDQRTSGYLNHLIFFDLKDDLSAEQIADFRNELNKLGEIEGVLHLQIGQTADVGDQRAISQIDCSMYMQFENEADFRIYQEHPVHLAVREALGDYLEKPPRSTDFFTEN